MHSGVFSSELDNTAEIDLIATSCLPCWRLLSLTCCPVILLLSVLIAEIESTQLPSEETVSLSPVGRYCCVSVSLPRSDTDFSDSKRCWQVTMTRGIVLPSFNGICPSFIIQKSKRMCHWLKSLQRPWPPVLPFCWC